LVEPIRPPPIATFATWLVVPMSTVPLPSTESKVALEDDATAKSGMVAAFTAEAVEVETESTAQGEEVPMPTLPPRKVAAGPVPDCETARVGYAVEEEAKMPASAQIGLDVVAAAVTPKSVVKVKGEAPPPLPQAEPVLVMLPFWSICKQLLPLALPMPLTTRLVEEAVPAALTEKSLRPVVEPTAKRSELAAVCVEVETESCAHGVVVPTPVLPAK